jgi:hypothetical protein
VPELGEDVVDDPQRLLVFVGGEDPQSRRCRLSSDLCVPQRFRVRCPG